jgi:hypothetical protein
MSFEPPPAKFSPAQGGALTLAAAPSGAAGRRQSGSQWELIRSIQAGVI